MRGEFRVGKSTMATYGQSQNNIGNLKKETYLQAMFRVYSEAFKVLKPGGRMILVLKDFVRNKKIVRLDLDTKKLCEAAGFRWVETKLFRLPSKSFWRVLYEKKYPEVDTSLLKYEFVEVFEKPTGK
jgi:predicted methyltransferase